MSRFTIRHLVLGGAAACLLAGGLQAKTITISCGAVGAERQLCEEGTRAWSDKTGHEVQVVSTPNSATERLSLYQQLLAAQSGDVDVFQIDVVWPGMLANHMIDLSQYTEGAEDKHFQSLIRNNTVDGRLVAMPWFTDAGVLYYRKDLLEKYDQKVPKTWEQLTETAETVMKAEREAGNDKFWGFVWQGRAYEGLTCDALEWVASHNGGTIVNAEGEVTINNPQAREALALASSWIDTISPRSVLNYTEEEARGVFQSGNALFMRNWPYAWALAQSPDSPVKGKVGVVALPKGGEDGRHAGTLGGWQLAVSKYSENPALAADLVLYLTSYEEQKRRAIEGSYNPTIPALYKDEEVLAAVPFFGELFETFKNGVPRPSSVTGESYGRVSNAFFNSVHDVLSGEAEPEQALSGLERELRRLGRRGW
ncbi:ABC transporter substrate-binding protein [Marinobacter subterrani]|uniref:Carbohydrate ABC transporter substrate-binding protein, CUT1 family n=1 Tax=Marinobacter subterrani TaxID=1658765 RepID=A0A0J7JDV2_9GAMM|nr:ABC transporter substrate-binding protein [Marinobacter subterrani]KMQ76658.1 carbohydrate ABC transporter substrate-binding protein, CUT1 family [Marinobacter subterrani]